MRRDWQSMLMAFCAVTSTVWIITQLQMCVSDYRARTVQSPPPDEVIVKKIQQINIMQDSAVELWRIHDQGMDCMLAVHVYPRPGNLSPAKVEIGCVR
jgi:hypothetical protein